MNTDSTLPFLGELFAKSFAVLLAAVVTVRVWRGATAAQRHLVWFAALVALLLLPTTRLIAPRWAVVLEQKPRISLPMPDWQMAPTTESALPTDPAGAAQPPRAWLRPNWRKVVPDVWLGGVFFLLGYRLFGSWRLRRLEGTSLPAEDARLREMAGAVLRELNIGFPVRIRLSKECRVPMTWGAWHPVLMLPAEALEWNDASLRTALRHEAGHISRHDYLIRWITQVACALYCPNPLAWSAARALRAAQEQATDDLVLRAGTPPDEYAAQLLEAARTVARRGAFAPAAVAMASPSTLAGRVAAIVDDQRDRRPLSRGAATVGAAIVTCVLALCSAAQVQGADQASSAVAPDGAEGLAAGATLGLGPLRTEDQTAADSAKRFALRIPIKARPGTKVNAKDLVVLVLFYDIIDGQKVVRTTAKVNSHWASPPADWTSGDTEELVVEYQLPLPGADLVRPENRKYYGHLVRLYYQHQLQAATSRPEQLAQQYPAPQTLPAEDLAERAAKQSDSEQPPAVATNSAKNGSAAARPLPLHSDVRQTGLAELQVLEGDELKVRDIDKPAPTSAPVTPAGGSPAPAAAAASTPAPSVEKRTVAAEKLGPIEISSMNSRMENGVAIAEGDADLKFGVTVIKAATIRYHPDTHTAVCEGKVEVDDGTSITRGEGVTVAFDEGGKLAILGPHTVTIKPAPARSPNNR